MNNDSLDNLKAILLQMQAYLETIIFKEPDKAVAMTPFEKFCNAIIQYEGANPANNNPFDFKYYFGGYLPKYGVVKESAKGFAVFESVPIGYEYGETCITEMIQNHPEWDFLDFFARYAPSNDDNNPVLYAKTIAAEMGSIVTANLKSVLNI